MAFPQDESRTDSSHQNNNYHARVAGLSMIFHKGEGLQLRSVPNLL